MRLAHYPAGSEASPGHLDLPLDAVTQAIACIGRRGSGKTYAATKLAELMLEAGAQVIALDPVGVWYGLRLGTTTFDIHVLGGLHGDLPLEPGSGAIVAELVADRDISVVLDVSQMLRSEQVRFATAFMETFYQKRKARPRACHTFIEESQEFIPQKPAKGEERMLHIAQRYVKLGRNFGMGVTQITQRPQAVSKETLNQTELVLAFQMTGMHERKAIEDTMNERGADGSSLSKLLPKLDVGHCYAWSPQWLKMFQEVRIAKKKSLDASSTPQVGVKARAAQPLTPVDVSKLRDAMAATIERAKQDDPKVLHKRIAELEKLTEIMAKPVKAEPELKIVNWPIFGDGDREYLNRLSDRLGAVQRDITNFIDLHNSKSNTDAKKIEAALADYGVKVRDAKFVHAPPTWNGDGVVISELPPREPMRPYKRTAPTPATERKGLSKCAHAQLVAIVQHGIPSAAQVSILSGYSITSSSFGNGLGELRSAGLIGGTRAALTATSAGKRAAGDVPAMPRGPELLGFWASRFGKAERAFLEYIVGAKRAVTKQEIAKGTGYSITSSSFGNALGKLRTLELVTGSAEIKAAEIFKR